MRETGTEKQEARYGQYVRVRVPSLEDLKHKYLLVAYRERGLGASQVMRQIKELPTKVKDDRLRIYEYKGRWRPDGAKVSPKTGGSLFFSPEGIVINKIGRSQGELWMSLAQGIPTLESAGTENEEIIYLPVAPVLQSPSGRTRVFRGDEKTRVVSRFSGFNCRQIGNELEKIRIYDSAEGLRLREAGDSLNREIQRKQSVIREQFLSLGIDYDAGGMGHDRPDNYTVEFIRKDAYEAKYKDKPELNSRYDSAEVTMDLAEYLTNPSAFEVVVRVIDFDHTGLDSLALKRVVAPIKRSLPRLRRLLASDDYFRRNVGLLSLSPLTRPNQIEDILAPNLGRFLTEQPESVTDYLKQADFIWNEAIFEAADTVLAGKKSDVAIALLTIFRNTPKCPPWIAEKIVTRYRAGEIDMGRILDYFAVDTIPPKVKSLVEEVIGSEDTKAKLALINDSSWLYDLDKEAIPWLAGILSRLLFDPDSSVREAVIRKFPMAIYPSPQALKQILRQPAGMELTEKMKELAGMMEMDEESLERIIREEGEESLKGKLARSIQKRLESGGFSIKEIGQVKNVIEALR